MTAKRKKDTGEQGNGGQFGSVRRKESNVSVNSSGGTRDTFPAKDYYSADELASLTDRGITVGSSPLPGRTPNVDRSAEIGSGTRIETSSFIESGARLGDNTHIGRGSLVAVNADVGDEASLATQAAVSSGARIGDRSSVEFLSSVHRDAFVGEDSTVGAHATVGERSTVGTRSCVVDGAEVGADVQAGDDVVIGQRARVDDGISIGDGAVVWGHITSDVAPREVRRDDETFDGLTASREDLAFGSQGGWLRRRYGRTQQ